MYRFNLVRPLALMACTLLAALSTVAQAQVETATSTPAKVYASTGGTFTFNIAYTGGEVATTDVAISYTANTTGVTITPSATCISPATPSPYDSANPNEKYVLWEPASGTYPANCGGASAAAAMIAFTGTATTFPAAGSYVVQVLNNASLGAPNLATNDVTVCRKTSVSSVTSADITEGGTATFTVNFASAVPAGCGGFSIPATLTTANKGAAISANTCTNIAAAATNCTYSVTTVNNTSADGSLPVALTVTNSTATSDYVSSAQSATIQVLDDEVSASVVATTASASETGPTNGLVTFSRGGSTAAALALTSAIGGTATYTTDYTLTAGTCSITTQSASSITVSVPAGSATCTINVVPVDDALTESAETVTFAPPTGASVTPSGSTATVTIADNDGPQSVSVAVAPASVAENSGTNLVYTFTRTANASQQAAALTVNITPPAANATRYTGCTATTVTFAAGSLTNNTACVVTPVDTLALDGNVTVPVTVAAPSVAGAYTVGSPATATGTITDNEIGVSVAATAATITEGGLASFTLSCTGAGTFAVNYTVNTAGSDGAATPASPASLVCGTPLNVTVQTAQNTAPADSRSLTLTINSVGAGAAIVPGQGAATVAVQDDDGPPPTIPTMGAFGLALFGLIMAGIGGIVQRRRK